MNDFNASITGSLSLLVTSIVLTRTRIRFFAFFMTHWYIKIILVLDGTSAHFDDVGCITISTI